MSNILYNHFNEIIPLRKDIQGDQESWSEGHGTSSPPPRGGHSLKGVTFH
jgi:hypothetical protein